ALVKHIVGSAEDQAGVGQGIIRPNFNNAAVVAVDHVSVAGIGVRRVQVDGAFAAKRKDVGEVEVGIAGDHAVHFDDLRLPGAEEGLEAAEGTVVDVAGGGVGAVLVHDEIGVDDGDLRSRAGGKEAGAVHHGVNF